MTISTQALTARKDNNVAATLESVLIGGDLAKLSEGDRVTYYNRVCESLGLNPLTKPFAYITLNGKMMLYALKDCTEQLRKIHNISVTDLVESEREGVFIVTAKVLNKEGRTDAAKGAVNIANLKGEALANALMKAETKAKRRATLSICGLGMLDETELETISASATKAPTARSRNAQIAQIKDPDERHAAEEAAHDAWAEKQAVSLRKGLADRNAEIKATHLHDEDGVIHDTVWEEGGERPATADDETDTSFVDLAVSPNTGVWKASYIDSVRERIRGSTNGPELKAWLISDQQQKARRDFGITEEEWKPLSDFAVIRLRELGGQK